MKNTEKEFYLMWSREQLIEELCRLNQVMQECQTIISSLLDKQEDKKI